MGKDSIFKFKPLNPFFNALGAFPVHRGAADREALRTSIAVIESGQPLVMFPEGTRQSGPVVQELFDGTAYVAAKTQVCRSCRLASVALRRRCRRDRSSSIRRSSCSSSVSRSSRRPRESGGTSRRAVKELTDQLHGELQKLFDEAETAPDVADALAVAARGGGLPGGQWATPSPRRGRCCRHRACGPDDVLRGYPLLSCAWNLESRCSALSSSSRPTRLSMRSRLSGSATTSITLEFPRISGSCSQ